MDRPPLTPALPSAEFRAWYWLKSELISFCRAEGLRQSGSKPELADRIAAHLAGGKHVDEKRSRRASSEMPKRFELRSEIGEGWRCSQPLRRFFQHHCGAGFRFNSALREFIHAGAGRTLADAVAHYQQSRNAGPRRIAEQFEYNRHTREFFAANPGATRERAIDAWWQKRGARRRR